MAVMPVTPMQRRLREVMQRRDSVRENAAADQEHRGSTGDR